MNLVSSQHIGRQVQFDQTMVYVVATRAVRSSVRLSVCLFITMTTAGKFHIRHLMVIITICFLDIILRVENLGSQSYCSLVASVCLLVA